MISIGQRRRTNVEIRPLIVSILLAVVSFSFAIVPILALYGHVVASLLPFVRPSHLVAIFVLLVHRAIQHAMMTIHLDTVRLGFARLVDDHGKVGPWFDDGRPSILVNDAPVRSWWCTIPVATSHSRRRVGNIDGPKCVALF